MTLEEKMERFSESQKRVLRKKLAQKAINGYENVVFTRLIAYTKTASGKRPPDSKELREHLRNHLPDYMIPSVFIPQDFFPVTSNGKIDKKALPLPDFNSNSSRDRKDLPHTPTEEKIAAIWSEILGIPVIGREENFFDLGGHSLVAAQVIQRINAALNTKLSLVELFRSPTLASLASLVSVEPAEGKSHSRIQPRPRDRPLPLGSAQKRLWFLDQLQGSSPEYNMTLALRLSGRLDTHALESAINAIVQRHDGLRARFENQDGNPVQLISDSLKIPLRLVNLTEEKADEAETSIEDLAKHEGTTPFDLAKGPLIRSTLSSKSQTEHVLFISCHHIVADGISWDIMGRELAEFYEAYSKGLKPDKPSLVIHYPDYAVWQNSRIDGEKQEGQLSYWKRKLAGLKPLDIPLDHARSAEQTFKGSKHRFAFSRDLSERFDRFTRNENATPFMGFLAAFQSFLHRYTAQDDIVVGTIIANRNLPEIKDLVGLFINTLSLRTGFSDHPTFRKVIERVKREVLEASQNSDIPFERIVEAINPERDLSRHPIFQVMLGVLNTSALPPKLGDVEVSSYELPASTIHMDLELDFHRTEANWSGILSYNIDLFEPDTIERMCNRLVTVMETLLKEPDRPVDQLALITQDEKDQLIQQSAGPIMNIDPAACLHGLFTSQIKQAGNRPALSFNGKTLSYPELDELSNRLAGIILARTERNASLIAVCMKRSPDMVVAMLGILKAGGAFVPIDPAFPINRISQILEDAQVETILTKHPHLDQLSEYRQRCICLDQDLTEPESVPNPPHIRGDDLAYVIYTSGSTGKPKGVEITHLSVVNFLKAMEKSPGFTSGDRLLAVTTISFDISILEIFLPLSTGGTVVIADSSTITDGNKLAELIDSAGITHLQATPVTWMMLVEAGWSGKKDLKMLCGGEPLSPALADRLIPLGAELWNLYGPTETTIWSSIASIEKNRKSITIGRPVANTQFYVVDRNMNLLPTGMAGELVIGGWGLARGYHNLPELTKEKFLPNPFIASSDSRLYRTGDLARVLPSGEFECLGRMDNQVKIRGFRIEPGDIEACLEKHPAVAKAVVVARSFGQDEKRLVAYFTASFNDERKEVDLIPHAKSSLPDYMVPFAFVHLNEFPRTPNGKIDRKALPEPKRKPSGFAAPESPIEKKLAAIVMDLLNLESVGMNDDFFQIGGNSLSTVRLCNQIRRKLNKSLKVASVFRNPVMRNLAKLLEADSFNRDYSMLLAGESGKERVFCCPGMTRNPLVFQKLAKHMENDLTFYGLELPPPDEKGAEPLKTIEEVGRHCALEIRKIQPEGPYILCGYSLGGHIAFETARQLYLTDKTTPMVFIFDSYPNFPPLKPPPAMGRLQWIVKMLRTYQMDFLAFAARTLVMENIFWRFGFWNGPEAPWNRDPGIHLNGIPLLKSDSLHYDTRPAALPAKLHLITGRQTLYTRRGRELLSRWPEYTIDNFSYFMVRTDYHLRILDEKFLEEIRNNILATIRA